VVTVEEQQSNFSQRIGTRTDTFLYLTKVVHHVEIIQHYTQVFVGARLVNGLMIYFYRWSRLIGFA